LLKQTNKQKQYLNKITNQPTMDKLDYSYEIPPSLSSVTPMTINPSGDSTWMDRASEPAAYNIRGNNYLQDGVKIPSKVSAMEIVALQYTFSRNPIPHIASHPASIVQEQHVGRKDRPFLFITNFLIPNVGNWVTYFARRRGEEIDPVFEKMLQEFMDGDDEFRNQRLKIIPGIGPEGNWIVRTAVGNKPAILGTKLTTKYHRGENYFEVEVDVGSSTVAMGLLNLVAGYCTSLDLEIAFLFESKSPDELPERVLGGVRAHRPNLTPPWWNEL
jgi:hypothetical protein